MYPTNDELIISFENHLILQEKFYLKCLYIDVTSILATRVSDEICHQNLIANSYLIIHILFILMLLGLGFKF